VELERLRISLRENVATPEAREHGLGSVDAARLERSIEQIASSYEFKNKPKPADIFDDSFLPDAAQRRLH
jgi:NitT/TauT family transport system substrate-binding protein